LFTVIGGWLALAVLLAWFAKPNASAPGLYHDEACGAALAKDFLQGKARSMHLPGSQSIELWGRPFPVFIQGYLGALKAWMLMPSIELFGSSMAVLRWSALAWSLVGLLFFMLWAWRLMGVAGALISGLLLGLDPSFFFISVMDWGPAMPSFLCRFAGFCLLLHWWHHRRSVWLFLGSFGMGLGFFNKIDFAVILLGTGLAVVLIWGKELLRIARNAPGQLAAGGLGFLLGSGLMIFNFVRILFSVVAGRTAPEANEAAVKLATFWTMLDGSHFYRLMENGGMFLDMYHSAPPVRSLFGVVFGGAAVYLTVRVVRGQLFSEGSRLPLFLLVSTILISVGIFLLPRAFRIHHTSLIYPFPHLIIAAAVINTGDADSDNCPDRARASHV
jgi:hypothetical protein